MVVEMEETREELISRMRHVREVLYTAQTAIEKYLGLANEYRTFEPIYPRSKFGGMRSDIEYRDYYSIGKNEKLRLLTFTLPLAMCIFCLAVVWIWGLERRLDLERVILNLPLFLCLAVVLRNKNRTSIWKKLAWGILGIYALTWFDIHRSSDEFLLAGKVLAISAVLALAVTAFINHGRQKRANREVRATNQKIAEQNEQLAACRSEGDAKYRAHVSQVEAHNAQVAKHNHKVDLLRLRAWNEFASIMKGLVAETEDWFPPDYYSLTAVDFFLNALLNYKAASIKELVLLFDDDTYRKQTMANQQTLIRYADAISEVQREQLQTQKEQLETQKAQLETQREQLSATRRNFDTVLRSQAEIVNMVQQSNMVQLMEGMRQSAESAALRATMRQSAADVKLATDLGASKISSSLRS